MYKIVEIPLDKSFYQIYRLNFDQKKFDDFGEKLSMELYIKFKEMHISYISDFSLDYVKDMNCSKYRQNTH